MNTKKLENLHIFLWLIKDCSWSQTWICAGMIAAVPTIALQVYLTQRAWRQWDEFVHNLAICLWIIANIIWMTGEFFWNVEDKWLNQWFFFSGLGLLAFWYGYKLITKQNA